MGRNSRARKSAAIKSPTQLSPDVFFKRSKNQPREVSEFWRWQQIRARKLFLRFGNVNATRKFTGPDAGVWVFSATEPAVRAFKDMAVECAAKIGYHGGPEGAVQFWMDHLHGDHIIREKLPEQNMKQVDFFTQHSTGEREMHIGRYKQSGVDHYTDGSKKSVKEANAKPMPVSSPLLPGTEPLIIIP
jgi:hypothetical protein